MRTKHPGAHDLFFLPRFVALIWSIRGPIFCPLVNLLYYILLADVEIVYPCVHKFKNSTTVGEVI